MIKGNGEAIKLAQQAKPGDPSILVALEALENLPDLYDAQISKVTFVPPKDDKNPGDFSPVGGGKFMPSTDLMNRISEARGVGGMDMAVIEPLYQDIDWNILTMNYNDPPKLVKYLVGYKCTKQGKVLSEDGTERVSDPCTVNYNAWERVCELFAKEEMYTKDYTVRGKYDPKYDTMQKRRYKLREEMKFAERKADSKARNVVIRTLCGMPTGYDAKDLQSGYFVFGKIVRSSWAIKSEHTANLHRIANGGGESATQKLFGPQKTVKMIEPETVNEIDPEWGQYDEPEVTTVEPNAEVRKAVNDVTNAPSYSVAETMAGEALGPEPVITREIMLKALKQYVAANLVQADAQSAVDNILAWLEKTENAENVPAYWNMAMKRLEAIEAKMPKELRVR